MTAGWIYKQTEPGLWTVGTVWRDMKGVDRFDPSSDHGSQQEAAERVRYLNGGAPLPTPDDQYREDYEALRDSIIDLLNTRDGDDGEVYLLTESVRSIARYVESLPCTCPPGAADFDADPCGRCDALGRAADVRIDR